MILVNTTHTFKINLTVLEEGFINPSKRPTLKITTPNDEIIFVIEYAGFTNAITNILSPKYVAPTKTDIGYYSFSMNMVQEGLWKIGVGRYDTASKTFTFINDMMEVVVGKDPTSELEISYQDPDPDYVPPE